MLTKKQITWLSILGSLASIAGIYFVFFPPYPSPPPSPPQQAQLGGTGNTQIADNHGVITITSNDATPAKSAVKSPSDQARADLQQLGVSWSSDAFINAIVTGDLRSVELFLKGGMKADTNHKGASAAIYSLQPLANNREEVLNKLLNSGLNPNANLVDSRVMVGQSEFLPPNFESQLTPPGYEAWNRRFAGPLDLWIVIRAAYAGPEPGDFEQLRVLANHGAKFQISLAFLSYYESIFGDTPVYWDVRNEVEKLAKVPVSRRKV